MMPGRGGRVKGNRNGEKGKGRIKDPWRILARPNTAKKKKKVFCYSGKN